MSGIQSLSSNLNALASPPKMISVPPGVIPQGSVTPSSQAWQSFGLTTVSVVLTGACTASVPKTILSVAGAGVLNLVALHHLNAATSTGHTIKITIDGTVALNQTNTIAVADFGFSSVGGLTAQSTATNTMAFLSPVFDQIPFNYSLLIEYTSSLTVTDKAEIYYKYRTS